MLAFGQSTLHAQEMRKFSPDGAFLLNYNGPENTESGNTRHTIKIYSSKHNCTMQTIQLFSRTEETIVDINISTNGALLVIKTDQIQRIYNVRNGDLIMASELGKEIALSNQSSTFIVRGEKYLIEYNVYAQEVFQYKTPKRLSVKDFFYFPSDEGFAIISNRKQYYIFGRNKPNFMRKAFGNSHVIDPYNKQCHIFNLLGSNGTVLTVNYTAIRKQRMLTTTKLFKQYVKEESKDKDKKISAPRLIKGYTKLSSNGSYIAYAVQTGDHEKMALIHHLNSNKIIHTLEFEGNKDYPELTWMNDSLLAIRKSPLSYDIMHVPSGRIQNQLNYTFKFPEGDKGIGDKKLAKQIQISNNMRYAYVSSKKSTFFSLGAIRQLRSYSEKTKPLFFDASSSHILVEKDGQLGLIKTADIEMDLGNDEIRFYPLNDSCGFKPEDVLGDAEPPIAYDYPKFERIKHISEVSDTTELKMVLQTLSNKDTITEVEFQIMDKYGNYYTGAADKEHRHLWCNLVRQYAKENPEQLTDFTVAEMTDDTPMKLAISVVLDYSGSMGMGRIIALEDGLKTFFESKAETDGVSIVKYDYTVDAQGPLSTEVAMLKSNLDKKSYDEYGGATALLDGTRLGIEQVQHETEFDERIVIVITDGNENSSFSSKNGVIAQAIEQGVKVYTIGFGDFISESYLKGIAYNTNGGYYRIYRSNELRWIYQDIYQKVKHYYKIRYVSPEYGKYKTLVKLCPETAKSTSLSVSYDNTPVDLSKIDLSGEDGFEIPFENISSSKKEVSQLENVKNIEDFTQINFADIKTIHRRSPNTNQEMISKERQEFDTLSLPKFEFVFDKTIITNDPAEEIAMVLDFMKKYPHVSLEIVGHTDNEGGEDYNLKLSKDRAEKVRKLLISRGANEARLLSIGMGATDPLVSNDTEEGRQTNRRVVFVLVE